MGVSRLLRPLVAVTALGLMVMGKIQAEEAEPTEPSVSAEEPSKEAATSSQTNQETGTMSEENAPPKTASDEEGKASRELAAGESVIIDTSTIEEEISVELKTGDSRFVIRVSPDGFVQFEETKVRLNVVASNEEGNRISFDLIPGEKVSCWPMALIKVTSGSSGDFSVDFTASGWAFVVRADEVRPGGLPFRCDDVPGTLLAGERLDSDREAGKIIFRKIGKEWPGKPVLVQAPAAPVPPPKPSAEERRREGGPLPPGVLADRGRDFPWQSVPLPVIAWEVFRPPDVSP